MYKNTEATNKICKLLMEQSKLIKQFEHDMQRIIHEMIDTMQEAPVEEDVHQDLIKDGIAKALDKNALPNNVVRITGE